LWIPFAGLLALGAGASAVGAPTACLASGDGYFRAHLAGAVEARIHWRNAGTQCEGESKDTPPGVRLSFKRVPARSPDLLFVFGLTGVREGQPAHEIATNLTVIVQGTDRIYGTLGDARCTADSVTQRHLAGREYRVEARGFCTQPAHAVRGEGDVFVSTFEFAGRVNYEAQKEEETLLPQAAPGAVASPGAPAAPGTPANPRAPAGPSAPNSPGTPDRSGAAAIPSATVGSTASNASNLVVPAASSPDQASRPES
jgi:hypothetical protein